MNGVRLLSLCPECEASRFPQSANEGHIHLAEIREWARNEQIRQYPSHSERLLHAVFDPPPPDPAITVSIDDVDDISLRDVDEIQAGDDGWIVSYGYHNDCDSCVKCGTDLVAVRFGRVRVTWLQAVTR